MSLPGEVPSNCIYLYDETLKDAIRTLKHELIDYWVSWAITPYKDMTNSTIRLLNDEAYQKERVVEGLYKLLPADSLPQSSLERLS